MHDPLSPTGGQPFSPEDVGGVELDDIGGSVHELTAQLARAIPSFLGLTVVLDGGPADLTLTAASSVTGRSARTSLTFSIVQRAGGSARFTLYAHQRGALVDLHADLSYLGRAARLTHGGTPVGVHLDHDLPGPALVPGFTGLEDQSILHRAEGVLIEDGSEPAQVSSELRRRAAAAGLDLRTYADRLLTDRGGRG